MTIPDSLFDRFEFNAPFFEGMTNSIVPAKTGIPEKRICLSNRFYFKYVDLLAMVIGLVGFWKGCLDF